jgi:hypothetical protein
MLVKYKLQIYTDARPTCLLAGTQKKNKGLIMDN